ncbi:hypothetical protein ACWDGI_06525 [Streptomyces sp. NPDC001220]
MLDAGKSADQADKEATAAWKDVVTKREAEAAEARRVAAEREKEQASKPKCYIPVIRHDRRPRKDRRDQGRDRHQNHGG